MASTGNLWWMTPVQVFAVITAATNFGASGLQTPLTMPMLEMEEVPSGLQGKQLRWLLHASEIFFPRLNASYTLASLVLTVTCYLNRNTSREAAAKLPYVGAATAFGIATTVYALGIMAPINTIMKRMAVNLEKDQGDDKSHKELRAQQKKWKALNIGKSSLRGCLLASPG